MSSPAFAIPPDLTRDTGAWPGDGPIKFGSDEHKRLFCKTLLDTHDPSVEHDVGQVGDITSIDPSVVKALQDAAFIPVISPIGFGENNESYNINADVVAAKLATVLKAEKLVLLTNTAGVLDKAGQLLTNLSARQIDALFADGTISGGMLPKISGALDAAKSGVNAVHIIDGRVPHVLLLEILTDQAFGTMIRSH